VYDPLTGASNTDLQSAIVKFMSHELKVHNFGNRNWLASKGNAFAGQLLNPEAHRFFYYSGSKSKLQIPRDQLGIEYFEVRFTNCHKPVMWCPDRHCPISHGDVRLSSMTVADLFNFEPPKVDEVKQQDNILPPIERWKQVFTDLFRSSDLFNMPKRVAQRDAEQFIKEKAGELDAKEPDSYDNIQLAIKWYAAKRFK
jgi:hypothetical protein